MIVTLDELAADAELAELFTWVAEAQVNDPDSFEAFRLLEPELYAEIEEAFRGIASEVSSAEWRQGAARPAQLIPGTEGSFSDRTDWAVWLLIGGRGSGKTRTGAEAVKEMVLGREWTEPPYVALVGQTLEDVRTTMVERTLLPILPPGSVLKWNRGTCELFLANGAYFKGYSSEAARKLRGFNGHLAWADEIGTWTDSDCSPAAVDSTWSNMKMAVRLDDNGTWKPRIIATTTPRSCCLIRNDDEDDPSNPGKGLYDAPTTVVSNMSTLDNRDNLSEDFINLVVVPLEGTMMWDQEVLGLLIDAHLGAFWTPEQAAALVAPDGPAEWQTKAGGLAKIAIGVDPSVGAGDGDECGIMVMGLARDGRVYILEDLSHRGHPSAWAKTIKQAVDRWRAATGPQFDIVGASDKAKKADRSITVVAEVNNGHQLVLEVLDAAGVDCDIEAIWACTSKRTRIEPVAVMTQRKMTDDQSRGMVRIAAKDGAPKLRKQMTTYTGEGDSPDRLDAFVFGAAWLRPQDWGMDTVFSLVGSLAARP